MTMGTMMTKKMTTKKNKARLLSSVSCLSLSSAADLLRTLGEIPDVLAESADSRSRRNASANRLIAPPPAGTPLLVSLALAFEHTGIYLGDNHVAELNGGQPIAWCAVRRSKECFRYHLTAEKRCRLMLEGRLA